MNKIIFFTFFIFTFHIHSQCFYLGADLSYTNAVLSSGGIYKDASNNIINPYEFFAYKGANMVRMRLFHTPQNLSNSCENPISNNDLNDVIIGFSNAKAHGMKLKLAIHYGDYFNDPNKQKRPQAWEGISETELLDSIYNYTYSTLEKLKLHNVAPDIISVGNETTWGFIDNSSTTDGWSWPEDALKFNTAFTAIDNFNMANKTTIKKAVHFTDSTSLWLAELFAAQNITNYDIIGISYYPVWSNFTSLSQLGNLISSLKSVYNKEVMIFETGVPYTTLAADNYVNIINSFGNLSYPISPEGQKQFFSDLATTVYNSNGIGVLYWEPNWISSDFCDFWGQGSSYENLSFYNFCNSNQALPIFDVFSFCSNLSTKNYTSTNIQLYPNPAKDEIEIVSVDSLTKIIISDVLGRKIKTEFLTNNKTNVSNLVSGTYFVSIYLKSGKLVKQFIIE